MNVQKTLKRIKDDPLANYLLTQQDSKPDWIWHANARNSYLEQYSFFLLSSERLLHAMSVERRYGNGPYWARRERRPFSNSERQLAKKRSRMCRFLYLDFANLLIHGNILLDRAVALSNLFLAGGNAPSFRSFNKHRKYFLKKENVPYVTHETYAKYVREKTEWFPSLLKLLRDKFVVHIHQPFYKFYGWSKAGAAELELVILSPRRFDPADIRSADVFHFNPLEVISNILEYLAFLANYIKQQRHNRA